jgi:hypothetical protein
MPKRIALGVGVLALLGSLAGAGESLGLRLEGRLDLAAAERVSSRADGGDLADFAGVSVLPSLTATHRFASGWSVRLQVGAAFSLEDDEGEMLDADAETSFRELSASGLVGYELAFTDRYSLTPVLGVSCRRYTLEGDLEGSDADGELQADAVSADFGARLRLELDDRFAVTGSMILGIPVVGSGELEIDVGAGGGGDDDADLDGGLLFEIAGGVEYRLQERLSLVGGLSYRLDRIDWDWDEIGNDGRDELKRFAIRLGAVFSY